MVRLRTHDLTIRIADRTLCDRLDVEFVAGQNWVILGANGSGKTMLLHTLAGLRRSDRGQVHLDDKEINSIPARHRAQRLGILFQEIEAAFPATVRETVLSGRYPHLGRWQWEGTEEYHAADTALDAVGLSGFARRSLATLSGGERRRVDVATLLTQDAPICLLDEPTNHLDLRHQVQILTQLAERAQRPGHLNIFVLHDVNLALRFGTHAILLFDNGECLRGPVPEIMHRPHLERLYRCRLRETRFEGGIGYLPE